MTAELAIGTVGVVLALAAVLSVAVAAQAQVAVVGAAGAGARAAARGEDTGRVVALAAARAGPGSRVQVGPAAPGGLVEVRVTRHVELLLPGTPALAVRGRASAQVEAPP